MSGRCLHTIRGFLLALVAEFLIGWQQLALAGAPASPPTPQGVVRIVNRLDGEASVGSGTLIAREARTGLVLSCAHLFSDGVGEIGVVFAQGKTRPAIVVAIDEPNDLSCLLVQQPDGPATKVADKLPAERTPLDSCGYGTSGQLSVNHGRLTCFATLRDGQELGLLELSGAARQGDSGGPILNARGEIVGVIMGTDGSVVNGTHCGRIRQFLAEHPPTSAQKLQVAELSPGSSIGEHFAIRSGLTENAQDALARNVTVTVRGWLRFGTRPFSEATVHLRGSTTAEATPDATGAFEFKFVPQGRYQLEVDTVISNRFRRARESIVVTAAATDVDVELRLE